jgi:hypothetical protein
MDVTAIRWESLLLVLALAALAVWALAAAARGESLESAGTATEKSLMLEVHRRGREPELVHAENGAILGRGPQCHIIFDDATVSKEHARLQVSGQTAIVEDLHSTNGTLVNGSVIDGPTTLQRGDRIGLGSNVIWFLGEISPPADREHL